MENKTKSVISDLHVHLYEVPSEEDFFELLDMAEANGVKCLTLLEFNNLNLFKYGLWDRVKDRIPEHYSGKIVSAVEFVTTIDHLVSPETGFDYFGYRSDIIAYDFDPEKLLPYFSDEHLSKLWEEDLDEFSEKLAEYGFNPPREIYKNDCHAASYAKQLLDWLNKNPEIKQQFMQTFGLQKLDIESDITRNLITNPNGALFFCQRLFPSSFEVFQIAKEIGAKVCLAHPAYMSTDFDTEDYIKTMWAASLLSKDYEPIKFVSGPYMLDTAEDAKVIDRVSTELNLIQLPSSDLKSQYRRVVNGENQPMMYCFTMINGEKAKVIYRPRPGFAIMPWIEEYLASHNGRVEDFDDFTRKLEEAPANLFMPEQLEKSFKDVRTYTSGGYEKQQ